MKLKDIKTGELFIAYKTSKPKRKRADWNIIQGSINGENVNFHYWMLYSRVAYFEFNREWFKTEFNNISEKIKLEVSK